ncbi:DinB family protein [Halomonas organivorans]|uniref:Putative damage-inducible protein DinB n=1 Tax=Halomonas organivorans TaxID=257772 RepID=A0A7W5BVG2_9GAMM|nr:DinB family protein [Halomonas organivorans]MBB3139886.1 putative damage-inducible protein DinB [Halomonas organivorans]
MHNTLLRLFQHKAWSNNELLTTLTSLGAESPVTALAVKALSHSYIVDRVFAAHMRRKAHTYTSANTSEMPALEDLLANIRKSDQEYVDYISALDCSQLEEQIDFVFTDGDLGRMSREEMLMHVITHGIGHRGQISAVMLLNSLPAPKDGFTTYLHKAEASMRRRNAALT